MADKFNEGKFDNVVVDIEEEGMLSGGILNVAEEDIMCAGSASFNGL